MAQKFVIGRAVKLIRETFGLTQEDLALRWGVTINFISRVENGRKGVSLTGIVGFAKIFDIPPSFIYVLADDPEKPPIGALQELILRCLKKGRA